MVERETLQHLDYLVWLGRRERVAERMVCDESTVTQKINHCCATFQLERSKVGGEWMVTGDTPLLTEERRVHQFHRWNHLKQIRIDGYFHHQPLYPLQNKPYAVVGTYDCLDQELISKLIEDAVVDVFFGCWPNVPASNDHVAVIQLSREPLELFVQAGHPILNEDQPPSQISELRSYPLVSYGRTIMPTYYDAFSRLPLAKIPAFDSSRFDLHRITAALEGHVHPLFPSSASLTLASELMGHGTYQPIGIPLNIDYGDALLVHPEYLGHPILNNILNVARNSIRARQRHFPQLECFI